MSEWKENETPVTEETAEKVANSEVVATESPRKGNRRPWVLFTLLVLFVAGLTTSQVLASNGQASTEGGCSTGSCPIAKLGSALGLTPEKAAASGKSCQEKAAKSGACCPKSMAATAAPKVETSVAEKPVDMAQAADGEAKEGKSCGEKSSCEKKEGCAKSDKCKDAKSCPKSDGKGCCGGGEKSESAPKEEAKPSV